MRLLLTGLVAWVAVGVTLCTVAHGVADGAAFIRIWALPAVAFVAIITAVCADPSRKVVPAVLAAVFALAAIESVLSLAQRTVGAAVVFEEYRSPLAWMARTGRSAGTFDTPLDLGAFLSMSLAVVGLDPKPWRRCSCAVLLTLGIVCTGSRTAMLLAVVLLLAALFNHRTSRLSEPVLAAALLAGGLFLATSAAAASLFERFGARGSLSTSARELALHTGLQFVQARPLTGSGLGFSYRWVEANLPSSFENAYLSLAAGAGTLVFAGLLGVQVAAVLLVPSRPRFRTRSIGVVAITWGFAYSSYGATNTFGLLAWSFIAVMVAALVQRPEGGSSSRGELRGSRRRCPREAGRALR
ncbi:O-antigen ligase family protein [Curtobacterium sp. MCSS17_007]|uniref:O-antigen ligase family protein n=1 Tax=Curtobacterium sp. MCSS17_007 TaxID=2175646 RepID=UPI0011B84290|nr:O-antigen ligase family protein [Curtobacterium sp. MCSS17_007]WIE76068.1 hypothetical protein DEJ22_002045 [Curtobacterium sp. MCSS17_007]